ncbi:MAG TPA: hypothetical protein VFU36_16685 [Jatrophihabitans sp.]|nr:hypothetical protein [Jatrophihabitans sp.]
MEQFGIVPFGASRDYRHGNDLLTLERYRKRPALSFSPIQMTGTVSGHPAQVGIDYVDWSGDGYDWRLEHMAFQNYLPHARFTAAELLAIANSMR